MRPVLVLEYAAALVNNYQRLVLRSFAPDTLVLTHDFWNPGQAKRRVDSLLKPGYEDLSQHTSWSPCSGYAAMYLDTNMRVDSPGASERCRPTLRSDNSEVGERRRLAPSL